MSYLPEEVVEQIFDRLTSNHDRNSVSLVNKLWYKVDRYSRNTVYIHNCYALRPERLIQRFPKLRSLILKGRPGVSDPDLVPSDWGGLADPWVVALAKNYPWLEEIRLKRMVVSDDSLVMISKSFPNFKSLVLICCHGFSSNGLAAITSNCRLLEKFHLQSSEVRDDRGQWLSCFPENCTSLIFLSFACLGGAVNVVDLQRLVARCPNLKTLRLNKTVPLGTLERILTLAPKLTDVEIGSSSQNINLPAYKNLLKTAQKCRSIRSFSVISRLPLLCLFVFYPICPKLVSLNMRHATGTQTPELIKLISLSRKLQRLWISDCIGDKGLEVVASTCKDLRELRVFPCHNRLGGDSGVTEEGLVAISSHCPKLHSLVYFCQRMTNMALTTLSNNCPSLTCFKLCISTSKQPDHLTQQPLDDGFGAIVQSCEKITKLSLSGLLTDQVFLYIGMYAEKLQVLSVSDAGESDAGILYVLNGCRNIRKLEIRNCPFGDPTLSADVFKDGTIRSLWMSSCRATVGGCKGLAHEMVSMNVEIINEKADRMEDYQDDSLQVEKLYMYRTLAGPRVDVPNSVWTL